MDFEKTYSETIALFTRYVAEMPRHTYLAPGDSAGEMVRRMKAYAKTVCLSLPIIHILSHEQSWRLYGGYKNGGSDAKKLLNSFIESGRPNRIFFLEDHYWDGDKIGSVIAKLQSNHGVDPHFTVMVGSGKLDKLPLPNTVTFTENYDLAYVLYQLYNRRKL